jgi:hypothetical protein
VRDAPLQTDELSREAELAEQATQAEDSQEDAADRETPVKDAPSTKMVFADSAYASSEAPSAVGSKDGVRYYYYPENTLNNDDSQKWTEGMGGNGVGEWVAFEFNDEKTVVGAYIKSGNWRDYDFMVDNCRFRDVRFLFDDGTEEDWTLADPSVGNFMQEHSADGEMITFAKPHKAKTITLKALSVYQGSAYDDLVLTQVKFIIEEE